MKNRYYYIIFTIVFLMTCFIKTAQGADLLARTKQMRIKAFYTKADFNGWDVVLKGEIHSFGVREDAHKSELLKAAQDKSKVLVRLYNKDGIKVGDILYVIDEKNLIVSKINVKSIFRSRTFGYLLIGYGNFRLSNKEYRVVQRTTEEFSKYAYVYKARGDYYNNIGNEGEAISNFKNTIRIDKGNPDAHLELGKLYLKQNLIQFAIKEFDIAYTKIARLYDNEDKYQLLQGMVETRYRGLRYAKLPYSLKVKFKNDGIRYAKEALNIYPDSKEVNYYLGMFYFLKPDKTDVKAKKQFLRVVKIDPKNADAYVNLAELYKEHKNIKKARSYAVQALKIDPGNKRARYYLNELDK